MAAAPLDDDALVVRPRLAQRRLVATVRLPDGPAAALDLPLHPEPDGFGRPARRPRPHVRQRLRRGDQRSECEEKDNKGTEHDDDPSGRDGCQEGWTG